MAHEFNLRLEAGYSKENAIETLNVENLVEGEWQPLGLDETTPGFLTFVYAILTCQHRFMRTNGAERNLLFSTSKGCLHLRTDDEWKLDAMRLHFDVTLAQGSPSQGDVDYIISRMEACPVSRNLPGYFKVVTSVAFN